MKKTKKQIKENKLHKIPLRITDTTLRDAHQSLWATRMRTEDILKIIDVIDNVGYYSLECWGGATFDVCLRYLREDPWERLRLIKQKAQKTPLQMLLRGQNLVGYKNYADDVVERFVALAHENGMDIFRVFDALNDTRNIEVAVRAIKKHGGHAQGTLCYTISPVHTIEKFVEYAKEQVAIGIDSLCIKDMAGILSPITAERLVTALIKAVKVPIQLHCHMSSGMAAPAYVEGVRAGAGAIDCAVAAMAGTSSQPPVETMLAIFSETDYHADLDRDALLKIHRYFAELYPQRCVDVSLTFCIDPQILIHQIPGGMISNFRTQLAQQNALDKLDLVLEEVRRVRQDLGWPPLVTPTSQIVGTQAVMNVLSQERYKIVPNEVKNYVKGLYGRAPGNINPEVAAKILKDEKPIKVRPASLIEPMLPKATENIEPKYIKTEEDILSYCILPEVSLEYFKWRDLPKEQRPETPADLELKKLKKMQEVKESPLNKDVTSDDKKEKTIEKILAPEDYQGISQIVEKARGINLNELTIKKGELVISLKSNDIESVNISKGITPQTEMQVTSKEEDKKATLTTELNKNTEEKSSLEHKGLSIKSPLTGTFYSTAGPGKPKFVSEGDIVEKGAKVCLVEAMKLFNEITAPFKCKIIKFLVKDGTLVEKDTPLIAIQEIK